MLISFTRYTKKLIFLLLDRFHSWTPGDALLESSLEKAWSPKVTKEPEWIQIDLGRYMTVTGMVLVCALSDWLWVLLHFHQVALARKQRRDFSVFESSCHLSKYLTRWRLYSAPFKAESQAGKLWIPLFIVVDLIRNFGLLDPFGYFWWTRAWCNEMSHRRILAILLRIQEWNSHFHATENMSTLCLTHSHSGHLCWWISNYPLVASYNPPLLDSFTIFSQTITRLVVMITLQIKS